MHEALRKLAPSISDLHSSALGPVYNASDTWQLVVGTAIAIVTLLMVFLIRNAQSRDAKAIQLKLDELIRSVQGARVRLVRLEELTDEELKEVEATFEALRSGTPRREAGG